jgi:hypothetical protein
MTQFARRFSSKKSKKPVPPSFLALISSFATSSQALIRFRPAANAYFSATPTREKPAVACMNEGVPADLNRHYVAGVE